eukprot:gnl/MRDRNA2_/MRDRNA2_186977_c0_seq1.p1 gnl/MRDRNA2_/MRDRNA2_186977_c0~~gnl/MRDRNA2_/MRDRNA2_186977_c0_seq1.p1  ORF type:complete len:161 (+),score=19.46 gnl/MRDRNA2_/MRDRNA2_186977_c0_seq1:72-554(+)
MSSQFGPGRHVKPCPAPKSSLVKCHVTLSEEKNDAPSIISSPVKSAVSLVKPAESPAGRWIFKGSGRSGQAIQKLEVEIHERGDGIALVTSAGMYDLRCTSSNSKTQWNGSTTLGSDRVELELAYNPDKDVMQFSQRLRKDPRERAILLSGKRISGASVG